MIQLKEIIAACGHITYDDALGRKLSGTGYLVAPNLVATCAHVVEGSVDGIVEIKFGRETILATILSTNPRSDCAVLTLPENIVGVRPLPLGGECLWKAPWDTYGFPAVGKGTGVVLSGIVSNPDAQDDLHADVLELTSPEVAAGMATPLHGFSGSPIVVNDVVVGHLKRFLSDPMENNRPAFGKVYATRITCVRGLLGENAPLEVAPIAPPPRGTPSHERQRLKVHKLLAQWSQKDMPPGAAGFVAAESLIQLGAPQEALHILVNVPQVPRREQLRALALAKTGETPKIEEARLILEQLRNAGQFDAETGGLLGGRYKQIWKSSGDANALRKSHDLYLETFDATGDPYPGINAAATALWLGKKEESEHLGKLVLEHLEVKLPGNMNHWDLATQGEAFMLVGDFDRSKLCYADAAKRCDFAPESVKTMAQQAALNLDHLGMNKTDFDDIFKQR